MITSILDEAVNGWIITVFDGDGKRQYVFESLTEAREARKTFEDLYQEKKYAKV